MPDDMMCVLQAAMSAFAVEEAIHEARLVREQRERLLEEKAKKKVRSAAQFVRHMFEGARA